LLRLLAFPGAQTVDALRLPGDIIKIAGVLLGGID
jgi:hypothetical protein